MMDVQVSIQLEAITALLQKLGYKGDIPQLINNCAYAMIRQELQATMIKAGLKFKDRLKEEEEEALTELREVLIANVWFFNNLKFLNGGFDF